MNALQTRIRRKVCSCVHHTGRQLGVCVGRVPCELYDGALRLKVYVLQPQANGRDGRHEQP
jgi:hypothetical protein